MGHCDPTEGEWWPRYLSYVQHDRFWEASENPNVLTSCQHRTCSRLSFTSPTAVNGAGVSKLKVSLIIYMATISTMVHGLLRLLRDVERVSPSLMAYLYLEVSFLSGGEDFQEFPDERRAVGVSCEYVRHSYNQPRSTVEGVDVEKARLESWVSFRGTFCLTKSSIRHGAAPGCLLLISANISLRLFSSYVFSCR